MHVLVLSMGAALVALGKLGNDELTDVATRHYTKPSSTLADQLRYAEFMVESCSLSRVGAWGLTLQNAMHSLFACIHRRSSPCLPGNQSHRRACSKHSQQLGPCGYIWLNRHKNLSIRSKGKYSPCRWDIRAPKMFYTRIDLTAMKLPYTSCLLTHVELSVNSPPLHSYEALHICHQPAEKTYFGPRKIFVIYRGREDVEAYFSIRWQISSGLQELETVKTHLMVMPQFLPEYLVDSRWQTDVVLIVDVECLMLRMLTFDQPVYSHLPPFPLAGELFFSLLDLSKVHVSYLISVFPYVGEFSLTTASVQDVDIYLGPGVKSRRLLKQAPHCSKTGCSFKFYLHVSIIIYVSRGSSSMQHQVSFSRSLAGLQFPPCIQTDTFPNTSLGSTIQITEEDVEQQFKQQGFFICTSHLVNYEPQGSLKLSIKEIEYDGVSSVGCPYGGLTLLMSHVISFPTIQQLNLSSIYYTYDSGTTICGEGIEEYQTDNHLNFWTTGLITVLFYVYEGYGKGTLSATTQHEPCYSLYAKGPYTSDGCAIIHDTMDDSNSMIDYDIYNSKQKSPDFKCIDSQFSTHMTWESPLMKMHANFDYLFWMVWDSLTVEISATGEIDGLTDFSNQMTDLCGDSLDDNSGKLSFKTPSGHTKEHGFLTNGSNAPFILQDVASFTISIKHCIVNPLVIRITSYLSYLNVTDMEIIVAMDRVTGEFMETIWTQLYKREARAVYPYIQGIWSDMVIAAVVCRTTSITCDGDNINAVLIMQYRDICDDELAHDTLTLSNEDTSIQVIISKQHQYAEIRLFEFAHGPDKTNSFKVIRGAGEVGTSSREHSCDLLVTVEQRHTEPSTTDSRDITGNIIALDESIQSWEEALHFCHETGNHLMTIEDEDQLERMMDSIVTHTRNSYALYGSLYFIGLQAKVSNLEISCICFC